MTLALLFPGQGAESEGFLHRLPEHPAVGEAIAEATEVFGADVLALDTAGALGSTVAVQIGLVVAGVATLRALESVGLGADISAGLSVGAYAAAVSSGALGFRDALRLVRKRAELMERAYPSGYGLSAISGLREDEVETLAQEAALGDPSARVYVGNVNAPRQIVVAGADAALDAFNERALGAGARKVTRLSVRVPSHCVLLAGASNELAAYAADVPFHPPRSVYIGNGGGRPLRTAEAIRDDLVTNMRSPVRWHDAWSVAVELGAQVLVEAPPGQVLTDLAHEAHTAVAAFAVSARPFAHLVAAVRRRLSARE